MTANVTTTEPAEIARAIALLRPGPRLPEPWYVVDQLSLTCDLCLDDVDELWPLADYPTDPASDLRPGEMCVCRRCADAVRPARRAHPTTAPAA